MDGLKLIICFMFAFTAGIFIHFAMQGGLEPAKMDSIGRIFLYGTIEASVATFILWFIMKIMKFTKK